MRQQIEVRVAFELESNEDDKDGLQSDADAIYQSIEEACVSIAESANAKIDGYAFLTNQFDETLRKTYTHSKNLVRPQNV